MRKKNKTEQPERKRKKKELASSIIKFLNENPDKQYNYKQISAAIEVSTEDEKTVNPSLKVDLNVAAMGRTSLCQMTKAT